jgi:hypothetical protein
MPTLLDLMLLKHCAHEFSWPRRLPDGDCYQVCLLCGEQYGYDWKKMSRTVRLSKAHLLNSVPASPTKWSPRARRFAVSIPIEYRAAGESTWQQGTINNISESGIFVSTGQTVAEQSDIEMAFEMPVEISGKINSTVFGTGKVIRSEKAKEQQAGEFAMAVAILDYKFLHEPMPARATDELGELIAVRPRFKAKCRTRRRR